MVQAIIMAGGEGSRLRPLTCDRPKPMVPMLNRPVMEFTVDLLKKHGISDIGVTLQYMPQEIINHFGEGSRQGVNMQYFIEEEPLGTAGSVKNAAGFIKDTFIVVSGDALTDFDLSEALAFHRAKRAIATIVLTPVKVPLEYGVVITGSSGEIRQFLEKPGWGEVFSDTVNTGIYILEPEVLTYIPEGQKFDFSKDLFPFLLQEGKPLYGISLNGYWCDIGNLKQYQEAHYAAMEGRVIVEVTGHLQGDMVYIGNNCKIDPSAIIKGPAVIGNNCQIGKNVTVGPFASIGDYSKIDNHATMKRAVVWKGTYVGKHAEIRGAVLCNKVTVKDRAGIFEGAVIGAGGIVEENARIRPETKVWPHKVVEKDTVLDNHLVWGTRACRNLFGADGIAGQVNVNLTPECAAKLGAVFGTIINPDSKVLISSDHHRGTRMIKTAVQAGLLSVGVCAIDGGDLVTPVHRNAVRTLRVKGGIHVKSSSADPEIVQINFFSGNGVCITRDQERKIENLFERDDFQRTDKRNVGTVEYMPGLTEAYIRSLFGLVNTDIVRDRSYRMVAHYGESLGMLIPTVFGGLGCQVINLDWQPGEEPLDSTGLHQALAHQVGRTAAHLGVCFDENAESVVIIDETGRIIDNDMFLALTSLMILDTCNTPLIVVPVTGSSVVETMAEARKGKVIRTKTAPVNLMNEILKNDVQSSQGAFNQSVITLDAISTVVRLIEYMADNDLSLAEMITRIPEFYMTRKETGCPWTEKGKVMRQLIDEIRGQRVELLDGVKVYHENGWALVLPDADQPQYHVYTEGYSYEFAESLADFYINKINQLQNS